MTQNPATRVAANVRAEMARADLRGPAAADALNLSQSAWSRRYRGYMEFSASEISTLAKLLGVSVDILLGNTDNSGHLSVPA